MAFSLFRAACRDLLTAADHDLVDRLYQETFRAWRDDAPDSTDRAHTTLSRLLTRCATRAEAIVVVRAAQASAPALGHNLKAALGRCSRRSTPGATVVCLRRSCGA